MRAVVQHIVSASKALWNLLWRLLKGLWRFITHTETPIGVTLALFVVTAGLTYRYTPELNQTFEQQKMVSTFVTENLKDFNVSCRELISDVSILVHDLDEGRPVNRDLKSKIRGRITDLQWRAVQLDIIFENEKSKEIIQTYKSSLTDLGRAIETAKNKKSSNRIAMASIIFTDNSVHVIDALAQKAGLKIQTSIDTSLLKPVN